MNNLIKGGMKIIPYPYEFMQIWVFVSEDYAKKRIEELFGREIERSFGAAGMCQTYKHRESESEAIVIFLESGPMMEITIHHEALHAALFTLDSAGQKYNGDNSEALTYLADYIASEIKEKLYGVEKFRHKTEKVYKLIKNPEIETGINN